MWGARREPGASHFSEPKLLAPALRLKKVRFRSAASSCGLRLIAFTEVFVADGVNCGDLSEWIVYLDRLFCGCPCTWNSLARRQSAERISPLAIGIKRQHAMDAATRHLLVCGHCNTLQHCCSGLLISGSEVRALHGSFSFQSLSGGQSAAARVL